MIYNIIFLDLFYVLHDIVAMICDSHHISSYYCYSCDSYM